MRMLTFRAGGLERSARASEGSWISSTKLKSDGQVKFKSQQIENVLSHNAFLYHWCLCRDWTLWRGLHLVVVTCTSMLQQTEDLHQTKVVLPVDAWFAWFVCGCIPFTMNSSWCQLHHVFSKIKSALVHFKEMKVTSCWWWSGRLVPGPSPRNTTTVSRSLSPVIGKQANSG